MLQIETTQRFDVELEEILDFIAKDSLNRALQFYDELIAKLDKIPDNPFSFRQRNGMDKNTREIIFKGYTIPIYIDKSNDVVYILGIFNQNLWG